MKDLTPGIRRAIDALARSQQEEGSWKGDYSGPLFLLPMYVGTARTIGLELHDDTRSEMIRYLRGVQNPDGGFGLGVENPSTVFTTVLNYVAWRLLGVEASDPDAARAREWALARGGALASASWGKFFLSVLGLHEWAGIHPVPPELWLTPQKSPFHPSKMWCHSRMVYLPMAWLYGRRSTVALDPLLEAIRSEIYVESYAEIRWATTRDQVSPTDAQIPRDPWLKLAFRGLSAYELRPLAALRQRSLAFIEEQIAYEDRVTHLWCIGPVNKLLNTLVWHFADPRGERVRSHRETMSGYLFSDDLGTRMNGYNSSELWDTAFAVQALHASDEPSAKKVLQKAYRFVDSQQIQCDPPEREKHFRDRTLGTWPFSTAEQGWPVADCTAEGLKASLVAAPKVHPAVSHDRLMEAVLRILEWQNRDGGWASYEPPRAPGWLERFNPSDVFKKIMTEISYVECTSACIQGLAAFQARVPDMLTKEIAQAIERGVAFLTEQQRPDGSWFGSWGVCFTYATWFGVWGLRAAGVPPWDERIRRAVRFLVQRQQDDGGWGESVEACRTGQWTPISSQAVMTSWALLTLVSADQTATEPARRAAEFLLKRQLFNGTWPREAVAGVFNGTCSIHYDAYRQVFPLWALSNYREALK